MAFIESVNSKANVKQFTTNDLPFAPAQPVINSYYATSTAGQTSIANLGFTVNTSSTGYTDNFWLFIDGKKLDLGVSNDYVFAAIAADGTSSQITFNTSYSAGLNIQAYKLGLKPEVQFTMDNRFTQLYEAQAQGFQGFVNTGSFLNIATTTAGTPAAGTFYSSIPSRAAMVDLSQDLLPRTGLQRIATQQLMLLQTEVGSSGEPIWGVVNDTFGQIRFGGNWNTLISNTVFYPNSSLTTDYVEVTFYGTGLNMLYLIDGNNRNWTQSVDGGSFTSGASYPGTSGTGLINSRNYAPNTVLNVTSGLTLGIHTVKMIFGGAAGALIYGFEIINQNATPANISVNSGVAYVQGQKLVSAAQSLASYSSGFTNVYGTAGTTGGRVIEYINAAGTIAKDIRYNASSASYLTSTSHTNEEVARTFYWREFAAGRSDDFSSIATSGNNSAAFTLDDGTTTMTAFNCNAASESLNFNANTSQLQFTFVGTGLDVTVALSSGGSQVFTTTVDTTTSQGNTTVNSTTFKTVTLASGLPYGSHVVRLAVSGSLTVNILFKTFTVWQPKTPALPSGAVQLGSYNLMANFAGNATFGIQTIGQGMLRKYGTREYLYAGSWTNSGLDTSNFACGFNLDTTTSTSYASYTFYGTGVEVRPYLYAATHSIIFSIDGSANLSGFTTAFSYGSTGLTFTASTGTISGTQAVATQAATLSISNLPLGLHTVKILQNGSGQFIVDSIDVITPIYSPRYNLYSDSQNTLMVGSNAISDDRAFTPVKNLTATKSWAQAFGVAVSPTTSSTTNVPFPDMNCPVKTSGGAIQVNWAAAMFPNGGGSDGDYTVSVYMDGVQFGQVSEFNPSSNLSVFMMSGTCIIPASPGFHNIQLYWSTGNGTAMQARGTERTLTAREI